MRARIVEVIEENDAVDVEVELIDDETDERVDGATIIFSPDGALLKDE